MDADTRQPLLASWWWAWHIYPREVLISQALSLETRYRCAMIANMWIIYGVREYASLPRPKVLAVFCPVLVIRKLIGTIWYAGNHGRHFTSNPLFGVAIVKNIPLRSNLPFPDTVIRPVSATRSAIKYASGCHNHNEDTSRNQNPVLHRWIR